MCWIFFIVSKEFTLNSSKGRHTISFKRGNWRENCVEKSLSLNAFNQVSRAFVINSKNCCYIVDRYTLNTSCSCLATSVRRSRRSVDRWICRVVVLSVMWFLSLHLFRKHEKKKRQIVSINLHTKNSLTFHHTLVIVSIRIHRPLRSIRSLRSLLCVLRRLLRWIVAVHVLLRLNCWRLRLWHVTDARWTSPLINVRWLAIRDEVERQIEEWTGLGLRRRRRRWWQAHRMISWRLTHVSDGQGEIIKEKRISHNEELQAQQLKCQLNLTQGLEWTCMAVAAVECSRSANSYRLDVFGRLDSFVTWSHRLRRHSYRKR